MKSIIYSLVFVLTYSLMVNIAFAQTDSASGKKVIFTFTLNDDIMPAAERKVRKALDQAQALKADYIIMELNTYGGRVDVADNIRQLLMDAKATTVVWVNKNAASAGALISIACDSIYMSKGANMGAATVVNGEDGTRMPDKYQSYMRSKMRATAEAQGRDPKIAEAMVDDASSIPGIIDSGKTLTLTTTEAIKLGFSEGQAESMDEVITELGIENYRLEKYQSNFLETAVSFLLHPAVNSILMLLIIGGIIYEFKAPGTGLPLAVAAIAAVFYFFPLYIDGLAQNWEILVFIVGLILLGLELFVIPGFGVAGISGILMIVTGLTLSLLNNVDFDFSYTSGRDISFAFFRVIITMSVMLFSFLALSKQIFESRVFQKVALTHTQEVSKGYVGAGIELNQLVGSEGIAATDLRPAGKVDIGEQRYDATADSALISKGNAVKVVKAQGNYLIVRAV
ncbi:MAG: NfeD family protein [Chitinophagales bacterium]|nr:NfeD family protein [Chitinophagales bacterium]